jgi:hemoglobin
MRKCALVLALGLCIVGSSLASAQTPAADSLYKRLGGYDAIAAVTDDFIGRMAADKELSVFFAHHSADVLKRTRQLVVDQLCMATGGPCQYIGRDMKTVHAGMGITEANWNAAVQHLVATLAKFKVPDREQKELLAIASSLKNDVVDQKKM